MSLNSDINDLLSLETRHPGGHQGPRYGHEEVVVTMWGHVVSTMVMGIPLYTPLKGYRGYSLLLLLLLITTHTQCPGPCPHEVVVMSCWSTHVFRVHHEYLQMVRGSSSGGCGGERRYVHEYHH
jgi:hypothetical protein